MVPTRLHCLALVVLNGAVLRSTCQLTWQHVQPMASACKVTAHLTSPPPRFPLGPVTGGQNQVSDTLALNHQNPLVPNINTHKNPKVLSPCWLDDPKDLPCTPYALQQVVPMLHSSSHLMLPAVLRQ